MNNERMHESTELGLRYLLVQEEIRLEKVREEV